MKKVFLLLIILLLVPLATALTPPTGGTNYYNFSILTDLWGSNNGSCTNCPSNSVTYPSFNMSGDSSPNSSDFDGINDEVSFSDFGNIKSFSLWFNNDVAITAEVTTGQPLLTFEDATKGVLWLGKATGSFANEMLSFWADTGKFYYWDTTDLGFSTWDSTSWKHIVIVWNSSNSKYGLYFNGTYVGTARTFGSPLEIDFPSPKVGSRTSDFFNGQIDEFKLYNNSLNGTQAINLYNYGSLEGQNTNFTITAVDYNGNTINNFTASINGTNYNTTTGSISTNIYNNDTSLWDFWVDSELYNNISESNYNVSFNYQAVFYPENAINITFLYENNLSSLNGNNVSVEFISDINSVNTSTSNGYLEYNLTYPGDYIIRFGVDNITRLYGFTLIDESYNELTLYIPGDDTELVEINVFDSYQYPLIGGGSTGVIVKILKYFVSSNSFVQISSQSTNYAGSLRDYIVLNDEFYKFIVEVDGNSVLTTDSSYIYESPVNLYTSTVDTGFNTLFSITSLYADIDFNVSTKVLTYVWDDGDNLATMGCIYVYRYNDLTSTLVNNSCSNGAAGSINITVDNINASYEARGYMTKGGENIYVTQQYFVIGSDTELDDSNSLLLVAFLIITMFFVGYFAIELGMVLAGFTVLITSITGLFNISLGIGISSFVLSLVLAYIISRYRRGGFL